MPALADSDLINRSFHERPFQTAKPWSQVFLGLDLGFAQDRTALAVLEEMTRPTGEYD